MGGWLVATLASLSDADIGVCGRFGSNNAIDHSRIAPHIDNALCRCLVGGESDH